jgi:undecaprenyl-diphosphatase
MALDILLKKDARYSEKIRIPEDKSWLKNIAAFLAHSGDSWFWGIALLLLWILGPKPWRPQIELLFIGILVTAVFVMVLKFLIQRPRPEGEWGQIYRSSDPHSFPSGHAARATMLTVIMLMSGFYWIGLIMIFWTLLMEISRIGLGVHYLSDIVVGTAIGAVLGSLVVLIFG